MGSRPKAGLRATATASGVDTAAASVADCLPRLLPAGPAIAATAACTTASSGEPDGASLTARSTMGEEEGEEEREGARPWYSTNHVHWQLLGVMMADGGETDGPDGCVYG